MALMLLQRLHEVLGVRKVHAVGDLCQCRIAAWQGLGLLVINVLQPVFQLPQKNIGGIQGIDGLWL